MWYDPPPSQATAQRLLLLLIRLLCFCQPVLQLPTTTSCSSCTTSRAYCLMCVNPWLQGTSLTHLAVTQAQHLLGKFSKLPGAWVRRQHSTVLARPQQGQRIRCNLLDLKHNCGGVAKWGRVGAVSQLVGCGTPLAMAAWHPLCGAARLGCRRTAHAIQEQQQKRPATATTCQRHSHATHFPPSRHTSSSLWGLLDTKHQTLTGPSEAIDSKGCPG
jgi:hypothetical protein